MATDCSHPLRTRHANADQFDDDSPPNSTTARPDAALRLETLVERCGADVVRLVDDPVAVLTALVGNGCRRIRMRNELAVAALASGSLSMTVDGDTCRIRGDRTSVAFDTDTWGSGWLRMGCNGDDSAVSIFDRRGRPVLECLLDRADLEALAPMLPRLEHSCQRPVAPEHSDDALDADIHPEIDEELLEREWSRCSDYASIRSIETAFRLERLELFERLDAQWASHVEPTSVQDVTNSIARLDLPCRFELFGAGIDVSMCPRDLRSIGRGRHVVGTDSERQLMLEPNSARSAFVVRKPTEAGLVTAIELFDDAHDLKARIRLDDRADADRELLWRSSLPFGRLSPESNPRIVEMTAV